jgi:hypothetical protein
MPQYRIRRRRRPTNSTGTKCSATSARVVTSARRRTWAFGDNGLKWGYVRIGTSQFQDAEYDLKVGFYYVFIAACDSDCRDIDLALIDPDGNVVATDRDSDDTPVVAFVPAKAGRYRVRATIPDCGGIVGCYWALGGGSLTTAALFSSSRRRQFFTRCPAARSGRRWRASRRQRTGSCRSRNSPHRTAGRSSGRPSLPPWPSASSASCRHKPGTTEAVP